MKKVNAHTRLTHPKNTPLEIHLGGELLAIRTERYVMATPLINSIGYDFSSEEFSFGFTRALLLNGREDPCGIMFDLLEVCINHVFSNPEAFFHVRDYHDMHFFNHEYLKDLEAQVPTRRKQRATTT